MDDGVALPVAQVGNVPNVGAGGLVELPLAAAQRVLKLPAQVS